MKLPTGNRVNLGKLVRSRRGQSMVEFAMVAPLFFLLVFGILDFGRYFFTEETLQFAMREAGRYAVTGQHATSGGTTLSRVASIRQVAQQAAVGLIPDTNLIDIKSISGGVTTTNSAGGPRQTVVITLTTQFHFITPMIGKLISPTFDKQITVSTTFMNEPFDPSQSS